ncbi:protein of unknown function [Chitinophaga jiangningensis]|uniref:DUF4397 domain-containing protein n=1 Tax=Chitinophaga jiangningensis TaxID=1419482 RepID=A0A1M7K1N8_9BACT|nr:DUF4397 domain-containing protein [Chitinophaga jiangningensis]SHM59196.1 protein of unknown function [Chitinophaga jiangningensis]
MKPYTLFFLATAALFSACKKTDYLDVNAGERPPLSAHISFVNARNSSAGIHFWTFTTQLTTTLLGSGQASPYLATTYGNVQINVTEGSGSAYKISRQFGNSATYTATGGPNGPIATFYHTVFAAQQLTDPAKDSLILFYDDLSAPPAGKAKLRFVHLASATPRVQVNLSLKTGTEELFNSVGYGSAGNGDINGNAYTLGPFVNVTAGNATVVVSEKVSLKPVPIYQDKLSNITLESGKIYTVFIHNVTGGSGAVTADIITHQP